MKKIKFLSLVSAALMGLALPASAGPRGGGGGFGGGGGHFGSGGRVGGFADGGSRAAPAFYGSGFRTAPTFRGAYFTGRSVGTPSAAPRFYYGGTRTAAVPSTEFPRSAERSTGPYVSRSAAATRQPNRVSSIAGRNRATDPRVSTAANRQPNRAGSVAGRNQVSDRRTSTAAKRDSFLRNHASERHDANWHRDWDRHHAHFHDRKVFVFIGGFWWGLDPWDYYPYDTYGSYPSDYYGDPDGYNDYPYDSYDYNTQDPYSYYNGYAGPAQSSNGVVSSVQSELAKLGYYRGAIDGVEGDETQAALARYQEDYDLSVTGTLTPGTLQALGLQRVTNN